MGNRDASVLRTLWPAFPVALAIVLIAATGCGGAVIGSSDGGHPDAASIDSASPDVRAAAQDSGTRDVRADAHGPGTPDAKADARDSSSPDAPRPIPDNHRPDDSQCQATAPPGGCDFGSPTPCNSDSQCADAGLNGRCVSADVGWGSGPSCTCTYDACVHDSDCKTGELCVCHGSAYSPGGNTCLPGNCRVDADCGAGGFCSPSPPDTTNTGSVAGYYCHTPMDACTNDSDCAKAGGALDVCVWSGKQSRWMCERQTPCY
jgi:hypothetical protein